MQTALSYRTNRDLFSNHYLDEHLPETDAWEAVAEEELREARAGVLALWDREKDLAPDRLEAITLPDPDDVEDDLNRYLDAKEPTDELDEKIEKTDRLIDEIVYELYELTDEEIEIVEEAVGD